MIEWSPNLIRPVLLGVRAASRPSLASHQLAFEDLAHRERAWQAFYADPEWQEARRASEAGGPLIERIVNTIWKPTAYSPLK